MFRLYSLMLKSIVMVKLFSIFLLFIYVWINFVDGSKVKNVTSAVMRHIRAINFPQGSGTGVL